MILPRSHTWMHLLPARTSYCCEGCPDWLAEPMVGQGLIDEYADPQTGMSVPPIRGRMPVLPGGNGGRVFVSWQQSRLPNLDGYEGVVAVRPRKRFAEKLWGEGFAFVRRYAVLPDLEHARWFVPIDSPAVSAAAFWLYTPFKFSAKMKLLAARAAIYARLPIWYRDEVVIGQRFRSPLEIALQDVFENREIIVALSSGALGPDERRKPSVAILGPDGRRLGFAKIAGSPVAEELIAHERKVLSAMTRMPKVSAVAPELLYCGEVEGRAMLVQSALTGDRVGPKITPAHHRFLDALEVGPKKCAASTELVTKLRQQTAVMAFPALDLYGILDEVWAALEGLEISATVTHTDFVPWNLRKKNGEIFAFDWDTAELDGLPLFDLLHHQVMVGYCLQEWSAARTRDEVFAICAQAPMRSEQTLALASVYLIHAIVRLLAQGHEAEHAMVRWYCEILSWVRNRFRESSRGASYTATTSV